MGGTESKAYEYIYTSYGQLARFDNLITGKTTLYRYDGARRLITTVEYDTADKKNDFSVNLEYNESSQLHDLYYVLNYAQGTSSAENMTSYVYFYTPEGDLSHVSVGASVNDFFVNGDIDYSYDTFKRLTGKTYSFGSYTNNVGYSYKAGSESNSTTALVNTYTSTVNGTTVTYNYTYDNNGNITKITRSDGIEYRYVYDDLGQLIREDNTKNSATYVYTYDNAGNILTKSTYALTAAGTTPTSPTGTVNYGYDDASWGDLLTSYNGTAITYDAIGNPLSYYNGTNFTFTWEQGRRLTTLVKNNGSPVTYTYNDEGIRTSKTVSGIKYTYHLSGSQIIAEEFGNHLFIYLYDADGSPIGMQYRNTSYADGVFDVYWFEKNLQGDIVAVYDDAGNKLVWYSYDAWGNTRVFYYNTPESVFARQNPFRYRGYYYDSESGFYYLNSRYYDPKTGRFISADGYVSTGTGMLGYNMFAYCNNNPVNYYDPTGESVIALIALGAVGLGLLFIPSDVDQGPKYEQQAKEKYNSSTIDFYVNELGTADDKVNVTFYPEGGLIHIENSYSIRSEYEKRAIISEIMSSEYYDKNIYGNCVDTMLIEWSAHNFVYRTSTTSKLAHDFFVRIGYPNPIESSTGVDFRKSLAPSVMRNYNFVTLWGNIQW